MFAYRPRTEIAIRILSIAVILFNALAPAAAAKADSFSPENDLNTFVLETADFGKISGGARAISYEMRTYNPPPKLDFIQMSCPKRVEVIEKSGQQVELGVVFGHPYETWMLENDVVGGVSP